MPLFSSPREVSGQYPIVEDEDSAHLAHGQIAHSCHHGIPVCGGVKTVEMSYLYILSYRVACS